MKKLKLKPNPKDYHWTLTEDIQRIIKVFADKGFEISESDAIESWERRSDSFLITWMNIHPYSDTEIYEFLKNYFEDDEK